jgi:hypothetical protein
MRGGGMVMKRRLLLKKILLVGDDQAKEWISKPSAIALAEIGGLHATVVHTKTGAYLRAEYHYTPFKKLIVPSAVA